MNDHSVTPPNDGDGYGGSHRSGRLIQGIRIAWNLEWTDQDGCAPPPELLIPGIKRVLQKWKDGKADVIDALPLPDPDLLNSAIPWLSATCRISTRAPNRNTRPRSTTSPTLGKRRRTPNSLMRSISSGGPTSARWRRSLRPRSARASNGCSIENLDAACRIAWSDATMSVVAIPTPRRAGCG